MPAALKGVELLCSTSACCKPGASVKGEFERRLQGVIDEVKGSAADHPVYRRGAHADWRRRPSVAAMRPTCSPASGTRRAAHHRCNDSSEYKKYFEKDPALARRFQPVQLHEPSVPEAVTILRGLAPVYEKSHGIYLRDDAVTAAAELSARYPAGRQPPTRPSTCWIPPARGCASASPLRPRRWNACVVRLPKASASVKPCAAILPPACRSTRLSSSGWSNVCSRRETKSSSSNPADQQRQLAERLLELRKRTAEARSDANEDGEAPSLDELESELRAVQAELAVARAEQRLVSHEVCPRPVAEVISHWTGVPLTQLAREHNARVANFAPICAPGCAVRNRPWKRWIVPCALQRPG